MNPIVQAFAAIIAQDLKENISGVSHLLAERKRSPQKRKKKEDIHKEEQTMKAYWIDKVDPEHYPTRALADQWLKLMAKHYGEHNRINYFSDKEFGQLRDLRRFLGEWTQQVIEWMMIPKNWRHFTAMIRLECWKIWIPLEPHIGFLVKQRTRAVKIMREALRDSQSPTAIRFVAEQDLKAIKSHVELNLLLANAETKVLAKIQAAKTLEEIQQVVAELANGNTGNTSAAFLTNNPVVYTL